MCGIVGYVGKNNNALNVLIDGLERLEYRGYDSAGVSYISNNKLIIKKEIGRIKNLKETIDINDKSNLGLGHTRWATHGIPSKINAHPHRCGKITIVHNGIIENYNEIKNKELNHKFISETDTEVAAALLNKLYKDTNDMIETIYLFQKEVRGAYAIGIINEDYKDTLFAIKKNSPLIIGLGNNENYIASDVPAILKYTNKYYVLNDGEFAKLTSDSVFIYDNEKNVLSKEIKVFEGTLDSIDKQGYDHFMLKEIYEQPEVIKKTLNEYLINNKIDFKEYIKDINKYNKICIIACGSAVHAGLVGKSLIEEYANIEVNVEIASEFRYKKNFIDNKTLVIPISQSGETADTLEALKLAKKHGCDSVGIINAVESSIARICDKVLYIKAGPEIAVATTKAYSAQVLILSLLAFYFACEKGLLSNEEVNRIYNDLKVLPIRLESILNNEKYKSIATYLYNNNDIFFIGRNIDYALCMEGSLKLKEISYIHSEAYAAGELKHGTISLIEDKTPIISIITKESIAEKTISNIKEVKSRGAEVILIINERLNVESEFYDKKIVIPNIHDLFQPLLSIVPLQLIAYEVAKLKNCDIDKPKNLAKSVTVE